MTMLKNTFVHIPGIGNITEQSIFSRIPDALRDR
jgi:hypothetical protein